MLVSKSLSWHTIQDGTTCLPPSYLTTSSHVNYVLTVVIPTVPASTHLRSFHPVFLPEKPSGLQLPVQILCSHQSLLCAAMLMKSSLITPIGQALSLSWTLPINISPVQPPLPSYGHTFSLLCWDNPPNCKAFLGDCTDSFLSKESWLKYCIQLSSSEYSCWSHCVF